jgi:hypothetical protein
MSERTNEHDERRRCRVVLPSALFAVLFTASAAY